MDITCSCILMKISSNPQKMKLLSECINELSTRFQGVGSDEMDRFISFVQQGDQLMMEDSFKDLLKLQQQVVFKLIKNIHFMDSKEDAIQSIMPYLNSLENSN